MDAALRGPRGVSVTIVRVGKGDLDLITGELRGTSTRLSATERRLVKWLAAADAPADVATLLQHVWGYREGVQSRTVYSTIDRVRKKIEVDPKAPLHLVTVDGGYRWHDTEAFEVPPDFIGRDEGLQLLSSRLRVGGALGLHGPGGVGKSRLAEIATQILAARFSECVWVELRGVLAPVAALDRVARQLGMATSDPARLRAALAGRSPVLVVLDDLDALGDDAGEVIRALDPSPERTVMFTSRQSVPEVQGLTLAPLDPWASRALLTHLCPSEVDGSLLDDLTKQLDHLPLALHLAAPWVGRLSPTELGAQVRGLSGLRSCVQRSWDRLDVEAQQRMAALASVEGQVPVSLALALDPQGGLDGLEELASQSLLSIHAGQVTLLEVVRSFIVAQGAPPAQIGVRALDWAASLCADAEAAIGGPQHGPALERLQHALFVVLAVLGAAPRTPRWQGAVLALAEALVRLGPVAELDHWLAEVDAHAETDTTRVWARIHSSRLALRRGQDGVRPLGEPPTTVPPEVRAAWLVRRGLARLVHGQPADAQHDFDAAIAIEGPADLERRRAWFGLAKVHRAQQRHDAALDALSHLESLSRAAGDQLHLMSVWSTRAHIERSRGELLRAEVWARKARDAALTLGEHINAAHITKMLGGLSGMQGRFSEGRRHLAAALSTYRRHGLLESEGFVYLSYAGHALWTAKFADCEPHLVAAEAAFQGSGFRRGISAIEGLRGRLLLVQGDLTGAGRALERALVALGDEPPPRLTQTLVGLQAICGLQQGQHEWLRRAQQFPEVGIAGYLRALALRSASDDTLDHLRVRAQLATAEFDRLGAGT